MNEMVTFQLINVVAAEKTPPCIEQTSADSGRRRRVAKTTGRRRREIDAAAVDVDCRFAACRRDRDDTPADRGAQRTQPTEADF